MKLLDYLLLIVYLVQLVIFLLMLRRLRYRFFGSLSVAPFLEYP